MIFSNSSHTLHHLTSGNLAEIHAPRFLDSCRAFLVPSFALVQLETLVVGMQRSHLVVKRLRDTLLAILSKMPQLLRTA